VRPRIESRAVATNSYQPYRHEDSREMLEPAPCDRCRLADRCKAKRLACRAFGLFMAGASPVAWNAVNRAPTRECFDKLLGASAWG
jgi:hypothetical protein